MEIKYLLEKEFNYYIDNKNKKDKICEDGKSLFLFEIMIDFNCKDYRKDKIIKRYDNINDYDIMELLNYKCSNIVKARLYTYLVDNKINVMCNVNFAIEGYIKAINDFDDFKYQCSCLNKVIALNKKYKVDSMDFIKEKLRSLLSISRDELNGYDFHLLRTANEYDVISLDESLEISENSMQLCISKNGFLFDSYFNFSLEILNSSLKTKKIDQSLYNDKKKNLFIKKAILYGKMGDDSNIAVNKSHYYSIALIAYKNSGIDMLSDKVKVLRDKLDKSQEGIFDSMIKTTTEVDESEEFKRINNVLIELEDHEIIKWFLNLNFIEPKSSIINKIKKDFDEDPTLLFFPPVYLNSNGKRICKLSGLSSMTNSNEEYDRILLEYSINECGEYAGILGQYVYYVLLMIRNRQINVNEYIKEIIDKSYIIKDERKSIVLKGIIFGFNLDFETANSILVPQFEAAVRELAFLCGDTCYKMDDNFIESVNGLEYYFNDDSTLFKSIDENLYFTLDSILVNKKGLNYRNNFAHGCIDSFNDYRSIYVWWLIFYFIYTYSFTD